MNTSTSRKVQYTYSEMASGADHSRPTGVTYPSSYAFTYKCGTSGGLNDTITPPVGQRRGQRLAGRREIILLVLATEFLTRSRPPVAY